METTKSDFQDIITQSKEDFFKILPLIPVWLIILGASKLHFYYRPYQINIFNYLDLQEILSLFLNDFLGLFFSISSIWFFDFLSIRKRNKNEYIEEIYPKWWINMSPLKKGIIIVVYDVITNPILVLSYFVYASSLFDITKYPLLASIAITILAVYFRNRTHTFLLKNLNEKLANVYAFYASFFIILLAWTAISFLYLDKIKEQNTGGYVKIEGEIINFDITHQLLGRTKNYLFVFTPSDSCTRIINNSNVKELFVKAKR